MKSDTQWPNFTEAELACKCCGEMNPNIEFVELMDEIQEMREELKFPFNITSSYRCPVHPIEADKSKPGQHAIAAVDINVHGDRALQLIECALKRGFTGIGVNQQGPLSGRFIHLDMRDGERKLWSY